MQEAEPGRQRAIHLRSSQGGREPYVHVQAREAESHTSTFKPGRQRAIHSRSNTKYIAVDWNDGFSSRPIASPNGGWVKTTKQKISSVAT